MSAPAAIRHLIAHDAPVLAYLAAAGVPSSQVATNIAVGNLGSKIRLPAITIRAVSGVQRLDVAMTDTSRLRTTRVQVTVHAKTGKQQQALLELVRTACPNTTGTVNGVFVQGIHPDIEGPDLSDPDAEIYEQSQDYMVTWLPA